MGLTTDGGKTLTTRDAEQDQESFRKENNGRFVHPIPSWLRDLQEKRVHIINVGPWQHENWCGSYGKFILPAHKPELYGTKDCPPWQHEDYAEMLSFDRESKEWIPPIASVMAENVIKNEAEMERQTEDGYQFAQEFLGLGRGQNAAFSLIHKGCLMLKGVSPSKKELEQANEALRTECMRLVQEARDLDRDPHPMARQAIVKGVHDEAAHILGLTDETWLVARNPESRKACPICTTMVAESALKCPACPFIFDPVKYGEIMAEQDELVERAAQKKKPGGKQA